MKKPKLNLRGNCIYAMRHQSSNTIFEFQEQLCDELAQYLAVQGQLYVRWDERAQAIEIKIRHLDYGFSRTYPIEEILYRHHYWRKMIEQYAVALIMEWALGARTGKPLAQTTI